MRKLTDVSLLPLSTCIGLPHLRLYIEVALLLLISSGSFSSLYTILALLNT